MGNSEQSFFFLLFLIGCLQLSAVTTPQVINLVDFPLVCSEENSFLNSLHGERVQVRGFWYPIFSDEGILSPEPYLKSCCIKTCAKIHQQLIVKGTLASLSAQRAVTLEGVFKIDPRYNSEGRLIQFFVLEQAKEVPRSSLLLIMIAIGSFILFLCAFLLSLRNKHHF